MGFLRTFGATLGAGLAEILLDRIAPPGKSPLQQVLDAAPALFGLVKMMRDGAPTDHDVIGGHVIPRDPLPQSSKGGVAWAPEHCSLGEFTCPKCGGHTWSVLGRVDGDTVERYCTNGLLTSYGHDLNPNTVKEPCMFQWLSDDDAKYFSGVGAAQPEQACVAPNADGRLPVLDTDEAWIALADAVGERAIGDETLATCAARLLREADGFIGRQSNEIARQAEVIRNYAFDVGGGEIRVSEQDTLVLLGGNWTLRHDDGSVVTSVPLGAKEAADHLSTATGVPFSAHVIGSPAGPLAGDPETRREIRASIAAPEAVDVSCKEYVERQAPRYAREAVMMEHRGCDKCGAERGRKCSVDCASTDRLKEKP